MNVYLPLKDGKKMPVIYGWQAPDYPGVQLTEGARLGLRMDDWIVIDCDDESASEAWLKHIDAVGGPAHTWTRKTPHGYHYYYKRTFASLSVRGGKMLSVSPKIDVKAGKGHQVVFQADGYYDLTPPSTAIAFDRLWIPERREAERAVEEWHFDMPEGIGDNSMMAFAGTFRKWGMDEETIAACLRGINEVTMQNKPMPDRSIRRLARQAAKYIPDEAKTVICPGCGGEVEFR